MITLRQRIFIIVGLISGLIIVFFLFYYFLLNKPGDKLINNDKAVVEQPVDGPVEVGTNDFGSSLPTIQEKPVDMSVYAKQIAKIFVERFATYSNQNKNQNIDDVLFMSTPLMMKWLETQRSIFEIDYSGATTFVVSSRVVSINDNEAVVEVETQQQLSNNIGTELIQKIGKVELVKEDDDWKVNGFYWYRN